MLRSVTQQLTGSLVCAAISFALMLHLGRVLGAEAFGHYAALLSVAVVALPLIDGGWSPRLYRNAVGVGAAAGVDESDAMATAHALGHALLACVALAMLAAFAAWLLGWTTPGTAAAAIVCMGAVAISNLVSARMRGHGRFGLEAGWRVAGRVLSALAIVLALNLLGASVGAIFLAWSLGLMLVLVVAWRRWMDEPRWKDLAREYPALLPLLLLELFSALLLRGDVAIAATAGLESIPLSYYAACGRLAEAGLLVFSPFAIVLLRSLRLHHADPAAYRPHLRRALAIAFGIGTAGLIVALMAGQAVMELLFGAQFGVAGALLPWVMASLPLIFANQVWIQGVVATGREQALPARLALAALGCCVAIAVGTRLDGARGAAIGFLVSQILLALMLAPLARPRSA
jgi:O-antigen/teichoic acid export membrane protein